MNRTRTKRTFTTFDPGGRKHYVLAGWDRMREEYWVDVWEVHLNVSTKRFSSRTQCEAAPTFADIAFILKEFGLHFPDEWAQTILSDRGTPLQLPPDVIDFGTYLATKPPKES